MDWRTLSIVLEVCANLILFFSMTLIAGGLLVLVRKRRIGMALGPFTWVGLALFLFAAGLADLFKAMIAWFPLYWPMVATEVVVAILGIGGSIRMMVKVKEVEELSEQELRDRYAIYQASPIDNLRRMREILTMMREPRDPAKSA